MTTLKWEWGRILLSGQQREFQAGHLEVDPDAGMPYRRERFTDIGEIVQGTIILDKEDAEFFWYWYKNDLRQGAINFTYFDCVKDTERVARIIDKPTDVPISNKRQISIKMMFIPQEIKYKQYLAVNDDRVLLVNDDRKVLVQDGVMFL
ncbi:MAG: hypothetical protein LBK53_09370 [Heliobacteriaceae bacterium]|jgi:hypothetical protein|nr:hypothetical protein [Heliobacteriaceae bacterium]